MKTHLFALSVVGILFAVQAHADGWRAYQNPRFGTRAEVPAAWKMGPNPTNGDGRVFTSPDQRATITVSAGFVTSSRAEALELAAQPEDGASITYQKQNRDDIVISGTSGLKIFYSKTLLSCHDTVANHIDISYPVADKSIYDRLVGHVAASLRGSRGTDTLNDSCN